MLPLGRLDHVDAGLVLVHAGEDDLFEEKEKERFHEYQVNSWGLPKFSSGSDTYMTIAVQRVVRQLDFVEVDWLGRPVRSQGGAVRVLVEALGTLRFGTAGRNPLRAAELEPAVADGDHLDQHAVVLVRFEPVERQPHRGEHSSGREGEREDPLASA